MEKNLELFLDNEKAVVSVPKQFFEGDYTEKDLERALSSIENKFVRKYVLEKYSEYTKIGFPIWKRLKINSLSLPEYKYEGYFKGVEEDLDLIDFEGTHRKYVLLSDIFSSMGEYIKVDNEKDEKVEYIDRITNDVYKVNGKLVLVRILKTNNFSNNTLRVVADDNAEVEIYNIHVSEENSFSVDNIFIMVEDKVQVKVRDIYIGEGKVAGYLGVKMNGNESNVDVKPYFLGSKSAIFDLQYLLRFVGLENKGSIKAEGALSDEAKVVFRGILDLKRGAKNSEAEEMERCILLSKDSKMEAIPSLLVDENEVTASHAASSAPLDEDAIFYLMSRGFNRKEAKSFILNGIFENLINELSVFGLEEVVKNALKKYIE